MRKLICDTNRVYVLEIDSDKLHELPVIAFEYILRQFFFVSAMRK